MDRDDREGRKPDERDAGVTSPLESRIGATLRVMGNGSPTLRHAVLARIAGRLPAELARAAFERTLRTWCVAAAALLVALTVLAFGLRSPDGLDPSDTDTDRLTLAEAVTVAPLPWFEEYSDERSVFAAMFAEESSP